MRRRVLPASLLCLALVLTGVAAVPAPASGSCSTLAYDDRCETRARILNSRIDAGALPFYAESSGTLVATGIRFVGDRGYPDIQVRAFHAGSGRLKWSRSFGRPGRVEVPIAAALGPRARTLVVAGTKGGPGSATQWAIVAFSVRTGRVLWERDYAGGGEDSPLQVVADGRNRAVYVAGEVTRRRPTYAVVAYDATSGRRLWAREQRPVKAEHVVFGIELAGPDLYVLGYRLCRTSDCKESGPILTRGKPSRSGFHPVWSRPVDEREGPLGFGPAPLEATPDGVVVAGMTDWSGYTAYVVKLYERSGIKGWTATVDPVGEPQNTFPVLAADPARNQVIVGEVSDGTRTRVTALASEDGRRRWKRPFPGGDFDGVVTDVGAGRGGVYATGMAEGARGARAVATVRLGPEAGRPRWIARYAGGKGWRDGIAGYLRVGRRGATVVLAAPRSYAVRSGGDWVGFAWYRNGE